MKVHYINILLFALPLNILVNTYKKKPSITHHTPKIPTTRSLCECELYELANYDNDLEMKRVMQQFEDRTSQRFEEYDERMKTTRQKCKEQCDKEIQKIILKDKLEKELMDKFSTLHTDIQSEAIPTCVCEKSLADKVEKTCLRCGGILGTAVPELGAIGGSALYALYAGKPEAIATAIQEALKAAASNISATAQAAGDAAGKELIIKVLESYGLNSLCPKAFQSISNINHYSEVKGLIDATYKEYAGTCMGVENVKAPAACQTFNLELGISTPDGGTLGTPPQSAIRGMLNVLAEKAETNALDASATKSAELTAEITTKQTTAINTIFMSKQTAIIASIIAIVIIVLIMVIIYLVLRYRRKKKMKKKLQYIKLLEE
ncbi:PIR protein [Plasmodium reichenowi]|uniref:PIR protein n=1 Tax=Plasmodium reichenowi TaxID=5854 RepID=A0A2P9DRS6_PLARE|nr:PIR protein [Plasmodium reichenowi]